jgi:predicted nucleic acid-binding protein
MAGLTFVADLVWVDEPLHREALSLLFARPDKAYSLCDAVSFVVIRQRGIGDALTTDRHFEQEGFVVCWRDPCRTP